MLVTSIDNTLLIKDYLSITEVLELSLELTTSFSEHYSINSARHNQEFSPMMLIHQVSSSRPTNGELFLHYRLLRKMFRLVDHAHYLSSEDSWKAPFDLPRPIDVDTFRQVVDSYEASAQRGSLQDPGCPRPFSQHS